MSDQRALLDECTNRATCTAGPERQTWVRTSTLPSGATMTEEVSLEVNEQGKVRISESVLAQLLLDAGWERTA